MRQTFTGEDKGLSRIEIHKYGIRDTGIHFSCVQQDDFHKAFVASPSVGSDQQTSADFVLIHIERTRSFQWDISRESFESIFDQCGLDPFVLYPMTRGVDGFYCLEGTTATLLDSGPLSQQVGMLHDQEHIYLNTSSEGLGTFGRASVNRADSDAKGHDRAPDNQTSNKARTFLLCLRGDYMLAWTFNPETASTRAILISYSQWFVWTALKTEIERQKSLIGHPLFLAFVEGIYLTGLVHTNIHNAELSIFRVEKQTNHSPWTEDRVLPPHRLQLGAEDDEALASLTRQVSSVVVLLALHTRRLYLARLLLKALLKSRLDASPPTCSEQASDLRSMCEAAEVLDATVETNEVYIKFLQERGKTQLSVLFNLIAQRDASANIELAKDSRTIAFASQHDSDSMKTIAMMTMAFLPATFFATFFATPLLQWNASKVIQTRFWVFWAFTIPITALVFALWFGITKRQAIRKRVENRRQRARVTQRTRRFPARRPSMYDENSDRDDHPQDGISHRDRIHEGRISWMQKVLKRKGSERRDSAADVELEAVTAHS
ncbi:MAG: hypothetical protein M1822_000704 [Bathelium mastoideum]|nr:MAG: hypothetical protein M1822_000704 [Bathelium mastoideum]